MYMSFVMGNYLLVFWHLLAEESSAALHFSKASLAFLICSRYYHLLCYLSMIPFFGPLTLYQICMLASYEP